MSESQIALRSKNDSSKKLSENSLIKDIIKSKWLILMTLPGIIFIFINSYVPMFGVVLAFEDFNLETGFFSKFVGFKNFEFLFSSQNAFVITRNTICFNLVFILLGLLIAITFAIALSEIINRAFAKFYQSVLFLPHFMSYVVVTFLVFVLLSNENGLLNKSILPALGIEPVNWYYSASYWPYILVIVQLWKSVGYSTIIYLAGIAGIDQSLYEAAIIDGATKLKQIRYITIPSLKPLVIISLIMAMGGIFRADFGLFFQVPRDIGLLYPVTDVIDTYVYRALVNTGDIGMASAAGLYQSVVGLITVLLSNYLIRKIDNENAMF